MFEKDAEEYRTHFENELYLFDNTDIFPKDIEEAYQKGALLGYNKANEWHYVKDKLPPIGETVLLFYGSDAMGKVVMSTGIIDCKGNWYKNIDEEPYMWQEIVLPKESK